jgi:hypothetical protein
VQKLSRPVIRTAGVPGGIISETPLDEHFNLPFVLAFAVLDQVLSVLITEKVFSCSRRQLGAKMLASKGAISWKDYALVKKAKCARNKLAHKARLVSRDQALTFIKAIEDELKAWGVI